MTAKAKSRTDGRPAPAAGLRARKREDTRRRIAEAGLRLFLRNGFEETTLDAIAKAAKISRRTFFHYFDSKEELVVSWEADIETALGVAIANEPKEQTPLTVIHNALLKVISRYETDQAVAIDRLLQSTDALRARRQAHYERKEQAVLAFLTEKWPEPDYRAALRMATMAGVGALRLAAETWSAENGRRSLARYLDDAFAMLRRQVAT